MRGRCVVQVALAVALLVCVGGCSTQPGDADCQPEPLTISPSAVVSIGQEVTVSSAGFSCQPGNQHGLETIAFWIGRPLAKVPVTPDGAFTATFRIPADIALGPSAISAFGPTMYICEGTGRTCARYGVDVTILR